jgi:hypothetical protein
VADKSSFGNPGNGTRGAVSDVPARLKKPRAAKPGRSHVTLRPANDSTAKWFKNRPDRQKGRRKHLVPAGHQYVSFSSVLQSHAYQHAAKTRHTVNGNCLCDTPDPSSSRRLFSPSRDYRPPPSRDSRQSRVLSTLHANPRRWLLNGYSQPDRQAHTMATTQASMIRVSTHPQDIVQKTFVCFYFACLQSLIQNHYREGQSALPAFCFCKGHCTRRCA